MTPRCPLPTDADLLTEARRLLATDPEFAATVEAAAALASRQQHSLTTPVLDQARLTAALALVAVKAGVS